MTDQRARGSIIGLDELDHGEHSHEFVGAEHHDVPFSIILIHSRPGVGPKLHRHPYAEVFVVESGQATFRIGDETLVVEGGHVVVSPPGAAADLDPRRRPLQHRVAGRLGSRVDVPPKGLDSARTCSRRFP
jgi:hypothetical protein